MSDFVEITDAEFTVDADVLGLTIAKLVERDDFHFEVMNGTHTSKIVAQAIEVQTPGSGSGLTIDQHNHLLGQGVMNFTFPANVTKYASTVIPYSANRIPRLTVAPQTTAGSAIYTWELRAIGASGNWQIAVTRTNDNTTTQDVNWAVYACAIS